MANFLKTSGNILSNAASKISGGDQTAAAPAPKKDIQTVSCPNCANPLVINKKSGSVSCDVCENVYTIEQLTSGTAAAATGTGIVSAAAAAQLIESPDSGLIYVRNYFDNVTWEDYCESTALLFSDLEEMVEKTKIKFGASPSAWMLDFESVSFPLTKKIEGLSALAALIAKRYEETSDKVEAMEVFKLYQAICESIVDSRDVLIKRLETDVAYAEKQDLEADSLAGMQATLAALKEALGAIKYVKNMREVPEVAAVQKKVDERVLREFAARGINARDVYAKACAMAADPNAPRGEVLGLFEMVRGYADADERIDEINRYYRFDEFIQVCGKTFVRKNVAKQSIFDPAATGMKKGDGKGKPAKKKKKKSTEEYNPEEEFSGDTISLYEVIDGKPAKKPLLENITAILDVYATRLYFIRFDAILCYYDIEKKRTVELDRGRVGDYEYNQFYYDSTGTILYLLKRLPLEEVKEGCIKKLLKKNEPIERRNNYSLLKISLLMDYAGSAIPALVNVSARFGKNLFYIKAEELSAAAIEAKKKAAAAKKKGKAPQTEEEEEIKLSLRVYNTESGEDRELLSDECEVRDVVDDYVIFDKYAPNELNRDLYVYRMSDGTETLIETNIRDYFDSIKGRIYYTVGNEDYCPLFSNDFTGNDRIEIMQNIEKIVGIRAGWMYAIKGSQYNPTLIKISSDGKRRIVVCTQLSDIIEITDTHIYYIDTESSLRVVCTDGKGNRLIATDIQEDQVIVDKECVYYLRHEQVEEKQNEASLYCMDMNGHNVRKLLFNVNAIDDFDEDTIIVKRTDIALFELTIPVDKKNTTRTERRKFTLTHYCTYKKSTGAIDTKLTLGLPGEDEYDFKKGCFGKSVKRNSTYKRIPRKDTFAKKNAAMAGAVFSEQAAAQNTKKPNAAGCSNAPTTAKNNNAGCNGCSSQLKK